MRRIRDPFSAMSHYVGAAAALPAAALLLAWGGSSPARIAALAVYGASLFGLFFASGLYHTPVAAPRATDRLRKLDHAAIYLLIAGTYTPFSVIAFTGFWRWGLLAIVWTLALAGMVVKIWVINAPRWATAGVYLAMGWLSVFALGEIRAQLSPAAAGWLVAGGMLYTLGAVVYITKKGDFFPGVFGFHELWHLFVLAGAAAHFVAVTQIL